MSAPVVATVQAVVGNVIAVNQDGDIRVLKAGDVLFQGETIKTAPEASVTVLYATGSSQTIGADANFTLHLSLLNFLAHPTALAHMDPTALAFRTAMLADSDPKKVFAAFHGITHEGDHSAYVRPYIDPAVEPSSGYPTQGLGPVPTFSSNFVSSSSPSQPNEPTWHEPMYTPPFTVSAPLSFDLNEANLANGSQPDVYATTVSQTFSLYAGSDPLTHFAFSTDLSYLTTDLNNNVSPDIFWVRVSDTQIKGFLDAGHNQLAITLDLQAPASIDAWGEGDAQVTATLSDHLSHVAGNGAQIGDLGAVQVDASDGVDTVTVTLLLGVQDDVPTAVNDSGSVTEDGASSISGNVLDNDHSGADTPKSFASWGSEDGAAIAALNIYGTLTQNNDGSWSYALDNSRATTQALTNTDSHDYVLHYIMQDADGDTSEATLTITIHGADDSASLATLSAMGVDGTVYEHGLVTHDDSQTTTNGTFSISASDGIHDVVIGGALFNWDQIHNFANQNGVVNTTDGVLTLTNYSGDNYNGTISYSYTLPAAVSNDNTGYFDDNIALAVNGVGGSTASDNLVIRVMDDTPSAVNDSASVTEDGTSTVSGNVLNNDSAGADTPKSFMAWGGNDGAVISLLNTYGTLTQSNDGSWSYVLDNSRPATQALLSTSSHDYVLNYTMQDADGSISEATLTITIHGADDSASLLTAQTSSPDGTVLEHGLVAHDGSQTTNGSFSVSASDGIHDVVIGGTTFNWLQIRAFDGSQQVNTGEGILTLTSYSGTATAGTINYSYTLPSAVSNDNAGYFDDNIALVVNGIGGSTASDNLVIHIVDDTPSAVNDSASVTEDATPNTISGNVLSNDSAGADTPAVFVAWGNTDSAAIIALNTYGTLTQNNNGSWSYVLDNSRVATQALTSADTLNYDLHYTIQDADGSISSAKLTITVQGADDNASVMTAQTSGPDGTVYEHGLVAHDGTQTVTGTFTISASDTIHHIVIGGTTFTLSQLQAFTSNIPGTVAMTDGTLSLTNYSGNGLSGTISYSYTLSGAVSNDSSGHFDDSIALTVNGIGGSSASDNLVIRVMDDTPIAVNDTPRTVAEDIVGNISGNVLSNDTQGADGATVTHINLGSSWVAITSGTLVGGYYTFTNSVGTYGFKADGSWTFDPALNQNNASGISADFNYRITDGDGNTSAALQAITVTDGAPAANAAPITLAVNEAALSTTGATGSNPSLTTEVATSSLSFTAGSDNLTSFAFSTTLSGLVTDLNGDGTQDIFWVRMSGTQVKGYLDAAHTQLAITLDLNASGSIAAGSTGTVGVTMTLSDNLPHPAGSGAQISSVGNINVVATDIDGSTATGTVNMTVQDDTPTAGFTLSSTTSVTHDESAGLQGQDQSGAFPLTAPTGAGTLIGWAQSSGSVIGSDTSVGGADGKASVAYTLTTSAGAAFNGVDSGVIATATGNKVWLFSENGLVVGREGSGAGGVTANANGAVVFALGLDSSQKLDLAQYEAIQHSNSSNPNDSVSITSNLIHVTQTVTDGDGDVSSTTSAGSVTASFLDDAPTAPTLTANATVGVDESVGVQTTGGATDVAGSTSITFNGASTTVAALFSNINSLGTDTDASTLDNGALSFASTGANSIVSTSSLNYGTDGPAKSGAINYAFVLSSSTSGLTLTDGTAINLSLDNSGRIIGKTSGGGSKVAFAIAIDSSTGQVYVAQYLSLHNSDSTNPNDILSLATGSVGVQVTLTDADGDPASSSVVDISSHVNFLDDAPTAPTVTVSSATVGLDETLGVQTIGGATDVAGSTAITFNGSGNTVAGVFSTVASKGVDPDASSLDNGALSFASTGASSIVTVSGVNYGVDGPASSASLKYALSVLNAASGVTLTDGSAINLSVDGSGRIVGTVASGTFAGKVAFAIAIDSTTGQVYTAEYLSLHQNSTSSPNDAISLATGSVGVQVILTDADGDTASTTVDISSHVTFIDDGPTAGFTLSANTSVTHDESSGLQGQDQAGSFPLTAPTGAGTLIGWAQGSGSVIGSDTSVGGVDGKATVSYALTTSTGAAFNGVDSGLIATATGNKVWLFSENGLVVGREGSGTGGATANANGVVVFALGLDSSQKLDLAQYEAIQHPNSSNPNDSVSITSGLIHITQTVTDGDSDPATATSSGSITVSFLDDAPTAPTVTASATVGVDETPGVQITGGATDVAGSTAITFNGSANTVAGVFSTVASKGTDPDVSTLDNGALSFASTGASSIVSVTGVNYGADGAATSNATKYALVVSNAASGITLTDGSAINLSLDGSGRILGTVASGAFLGKVAFALAIDSSTGQLYVGQYLSLHQNDTTSGNDVLSLATGRVGVQVTLTDGDGDTTSTTADISSHVTFLDDGPTAPTLTASSTTVGVDETSGVQTTGGASDVAGSTTITYNGASTTVAAVFSSVANPGADPDVSTLDNGALSFASSGASSMVTLNNVNYGADGPATSGATKYALIVSNMASGVTLTDGSAINLSLDGSGRILGTVASGTFAGQVAFALAMDASTGQLYAAQYLSLHQSDATNANDVLSLAAGSVGVQATLTDGDGDTVSSTVTDISSHVTFLDDGPSLTTSMSAVIPNEVGTVTGFMTLSAGADGLASFNVTGPSIANVVYSQTTQANGTTTLTGSTSTGTNIFSLTLNPDATYTFNLIAPQTTITFTESLTTLTSGNSVFSETSDGLIEFSTTAGNTISSSTQGFGVNDQRVSNGEQFTMEFHSVADLGVDDPASSNPRYVNTVSLNYDSVNLGNQSNNNFITYTWTALNSSTNQTSNGTITVSSSAAGTLLVDPGFSFNLLTIAGTGGISGSGKGARFQTADYTYQVVPSDQAFAFNVAAVDGDGDVTAAQTLSVHQVAAGTGGNFTLAGSTGDDTIAGSTHTDTITGGGGFNIADYSGSTNAVSINLNDSGNASGAPTTFSSPTDGTIGGGDATGDTLTGIQGLIGGLGNDYLFGNSSANYLSGGAGDDTINGEGGNDTIIGGAGNDTLTGGTGMDTFVWKAGDQGTSASPAIDKITDFSMTDGDVLNLSSLLQGAGATTASLQNYLTFTTSGSNTALNIDVDGPANGAAVTQQIVLQGVTMSQLAGGASNPTSADVITHLLATHQLVVG